MEKRTPLLRGVSYHIEPSVLSKTYLPISTRPWRRGFSVLAAAMVKMGRKSQREWSSEEDGRGLINALWPSRLAGQDDVARAGSRGRRMT